MAQGINVVLLIFFMIPFIVFPIQLGRKLVGKNYQIITATGNFMTTNATLAQSTNQTIRYITSQTKQNDYIFNTQSESAFYVFTNRRNPTYYDSLIDLMLRPSTDKQAAVCNDIISKHTKAIIHMANDNTTDREGFAKQLSLLENCITSNFKLAEKFGSNWIYIPK